MTALYPLRNNLYYKYQRVKNIDASRNAHTKEALVPPNALTVDSHYIPITHRDI